MKTFALCILALPAVAHASHFKFATPPGWIDLGPHAPPENFARLLPEAARIAKNPAFAAYAMDLAHADDGFGENFNAIITPGVRRMTPSALDQLADEYTRSLHGGPFSGTITRREVLLLHGVHVGSFTVDSTLGALRMRQLTYFFPGDGETAVVTYTATPETFEEYRPLFERAAAATVGVREPSFFHIDGPRDLGFLGGTLTAVLTSALLAFLLGRRRLRT
jgi:hypothetical protein